VSRDEIHLCEGFTLDLARGCLRRGGEEVHLRPQSYEVLKYLAEHRGRLVSKNQLIEEVWRGRAVTDGSVGKCIEEVRESLGGQGRQYVRNVRGRGYLLDPEAGGREGLENGTVWTEQVDVLKVVVEDEAEAGPEGRSNQPASRPAVLRAHTAAAGAALWALGAEYTVGKIRRHKRVPVIALAALTLAAAGVVYFTRPVPRGQPIRSVAVLPFANASGDPALEYLSDGLSESLIDRLSQLPGVKVIARTSSFKYKGREVDPREAARELGVEALIVGRVAQRDGDLQVRAELLDARAGAHLWGEQYSRRASDMQAVQEEIARTVSEKLRLRLSGEQEQRLAKRATENTRAYQFYLNGLFHLRQGGIENARRALDNFNQALAMDPDFALAWAGVASIHLGLAGNSLVDPKEANAKAKAAAQTALRLDETLPEAHTTLALIKMHEWDWAGAERDFKLAIGLNPSLVRSHIRYADYLSVMGRHEEALAENKRAQELDPLYIAWRRQEARLLHIAGRIDEAIELMRETFKAEPPNAGALRSLGFMYEGRGRYEEAVAAHEKANSMEGETTGGLCYLGWALAGASRRREAQAILDRLKTTEEYVSPAELAALHAVLGDKEGAMALLEKAYAAHDLQLQYLKIATQYDRLRSEPRFQDLVRRVGLPA
jgi:TolB-like protein/Tfp pilus assembly protein PilF